MKNQKMILAAVALVAVIAIMLGVWFATRPETNQGQKSITVIVVHQDGKEETFSYDTTAEYLADVLLENQLIKATEGPYGLVIEEADGERAVWEENGAYWALYVGEEYANTGVSTTPVNDGETYKLVYTVG